MNRNLFTRPLTWMFAVATALRLSAVEITLPAEKMTLVESPLPGYTLAVALCSTCHSAEYMAYQPPSARAYWQATVVKMQKTFGAPIPDNVIEPVVDYLAKTYGTERAGALQPPKSPPANSPSPAKK